MNANNIFQKPTGAKQGDAQAKPSTEKKERAEFLSPFVPITEEMGFKFASFSDGDHAIRLIPSMVAGSDPVIEVTVLPVKHKAANGQIVEGKIVAGPWFFQQVQPFLLANYKDRFVRGQGDKQTGDVKLRTQKRIVFFCAAKRQNKEGQETCNLLLANLPGTNYPGAKVGDGEVFKEEFLEDFDADNGRIIKVKVSADPQNPRFRTMRATPDRNPTPIDDSWMTCIPKQGIPALRTLLRESTTEEIWNCLEATLPKDVYERLRSEIQF